MRGKEITLYRVEKGNNWYRLSARLVGRSLLMEGQDFTALAKGMYGDEEYEYFYSFDAENTKKLSKALGGGNLLKKLKAFYGGEIKNKEFAEFCGNNGVTYFRGSV